MRGLTDSTKSHHALGDQLLAVVDRIACFPGQMGQSAGERIMTSQAARCQDMADLVGEPVYLGIHHGRDRIHDGA